MGRDIGLRVWGWGDMVVLADKTQVHFLSKIKYVRSFSGLCFLIVMFQKTVII